MTKSRRRVLMALAGLVFLALIIVGIGITLVRSQWFRDQLRNRIVTEVETATGGRVQIGAFDFDWHTLTATLRNVTIRGTEPLQGPPLLHADDLVVGLKIISILKRQVDIALLRIDTPQAFLLIAADGTTNVPSPKIARRSNKSGLETILDIAIGRFELNDGSAQVIGGASGVSETQAYSARGDHLKALFTFDTAVPRYHGDISIAPALLTYGGYKPVPANISATLAIEKNLIVVEKSLIKSRESEVNLNGRIENFAAPVVSAEYRAKLSVEEAGSILKLKSRQSGWIEVNGSGTYKSAADYALSGHAKAYAVAFHVPGVDLRNLRAEANLNGGPQTITVSELRAWSFGGEFTGKAVITDFERVKVNGDLQHLDLRETAALATAQKVPYDASVSGPLFVEGRISDLKHNRFTATARLSLAPSGKGTPVHGLIDAKYSGERDVLDLGKSFIALPNTRADFLGVLGQSLDVRFASSDLNDILPLVPSMREAPLRMTSGGQVLFDGKVTGRLTDPTVAGHFSAFHLIADQQPLDQVAADVTANRNRVTISKGTLNQKEVTAAFDGSLGLNNWTPENNSPVTAFVGLRNAAMSALLALAGRPNVPLTGTLNGTAEITGSLGNPQAVADLNLVKGSAWGEPYDKIEAHLDSPGRSDQKLAAKLIAGSKQINVNASYKHDAQDMLPGRLNFDVTSNDVALAQIALLHQREPDVTGTAKVKASGTVEISRDRAGQPVLTVSRVNGEADVTGLQLQSKRLGDLRLTAATQEVSGSTKLDLALRSNLAEAQITGDGQWTLSGDYPGSANLRFASVHVETLRRLFLTPEQASSIPVTGTLEGTLNVAGPATKPDQLTATLEIPKLELRPDANFSAARSVVDLTLHNQGPLRLKLANNTVDVENAHFRAVDSDFAITGKAQLTGQQSLDLNVNGQVNLAILHLFDVNFISSGHMVLDAHVRGDIHSPQPTGSIVLANANFAIADLPNGLSNANGSLLLSGTQATIQSLTAESGGGKVNVTGYAAFPNGDLSVRFNATAKGVRIRYPEGVSTTADATLSLAGTAEHSLLSGTVTVERLAFNPRTDLGSILSSAGAPPETPSASVGFTNNLQFDVQIQTATDITFSSTYTQSIEADASLRLRGTLSNPVLLGRVNITQGELTFFGNKYTINQGSISFFNPVKLEPILNIDLETVARGVDVTLTVSGPIAKLNVSYRSDPPLQFSDIVGLLATGRAPNDATIAARQPTAPAQSWQQMGASALLGQAIANPVAGRLQRFFGVSSLKIDPTISGATGNPQAKVTLEQQVTPDITFTYITDVANAQQQIIRIEWDLSKNWSAIAQRDENGEFGVNFLYRKQFK